MSGLPVKVVHSDRVAVPSERPARENGTRTTTSSVTSSSHQSNIQVTRVICDFIQHLVETKISPHLQGLTDMISKNQQQGEQGNLIDITQPDQINQVQDLHMRSGLLESENLRLGQVESEKNEAIQKLKESEQKVRRLHKIIVESGVGDKGPTEDEIIGKFRELNQAIMHISHKYYSTVEIPTIDINTIGSRSWRAFYGIIVGPISNVNKTLWFRSMVANVIHRYLFHSGNPIFGFGSGNSHEDIEECMKAFEKELIDSKKVAMDDIVEWRSRTVSAGRLLGQRPACYNELCNKLWGHIVNFSYRFTKEEVDSLNTSVDDIARKAVDLSLLLRGSKMGYSWESKSVNSPFDHSDMEVLESLDEARDADFSKACVAFTVFGGVFKTGGTLGNGRVVLQKAEVVVKKA
ncbi:MAG: hypothetical protein M1812_007852 [Candelaria pacifica]|nr:MAG: hypothetical protein M1812_007852 [Candelaria pacifica]